MRCKDEGGRFADLTCEFNHLGSQLFKIKTPSQSFGKHHKEGFTPL